MKNTLSYYLKSKVKSVSEEDLEVILSNFTKLELTKNKVILKEGQICDNLYFLESGIVRWFSKQGKEEITRHLTVPPILFTEQESLNNFSPSKTTILTLTPSVLYKISRNSNQELLQNVPTWSRFILSLLREVQSLFEERNRKQSDLTAEERYLDFMKTYGTFANQIPLQHIASYLGIKPPSLSRIRKNLATQ